ncbi:MAG: glycoside hydrolase family 2 TIM barrel-domain containing protein [Draconibacterium sp.]
MKRILFSFVLLSLNFNLVFAQEVEFSPSFWEDPSVFEIGQTAPHAFFIPYNNADDALKNKKSPNFLLLNGKWKFRLFETPDSVPEDFSRPKFDVKEWGEITVPSNWQMEGFDHPKFRNIALTFESDPPKIPDYFNPTGCYKLKFEMPKTWSEKEIFLRFEGVKSAAYIWVNGKRVGYNEGGFEPAEFNITPFLVKGENDLSVQVMRFSDGSYLENQDMWRLSGIFRDVKLYAKHKTFIHDYYVVTDFDSKYKDASLNIDFDIKNMIPDSVSGLIEVDVFNTDGRSILKDGKLTDSYAIDTFSTQKVKISTLVIDPLKWSAEYPNLFTMLVQLKDEKGEILEVFSKKIGFREVEYKNKILTINGVPVKLNGVNSHMHHPEHGQAVPLETLRKDLLLMKQFNINCVRTCHYPPTPEYIDMANELGIYVFDEVGDETHANEWLSERSEWTEMYRDRSRKLVYRDRNQPSVIVWSAGNESGKGSNIAEVIKTGKAIDPSRPAWMYGGNDFYIPFEDIVGPRYWIPIDYKNLAEGKVLPTGDNRASFMDEYLAATGNGLGALDEYWELIWKYPRLTGGAIWDWISPGVKTPRWILRDLSPAKNDGQIMGRPEFTEGKNGRGLQFSGHDDWVEFYRDPSLDISGNQLSIGFWVNTSKIPQHNTFITKGKHGFGIIMENSETLEFYIHNVKRISAKAKVAADFYDNWHFVAGIYDGSKLMLYIDETLVAQTGFSGNISDTPFPLCIGREAETQDQGEFSGRLSKMIIDDLRVFNKAVSVDELKTKPENAVLALDFETDEKDGDFFAIGLGGRTYGIIWPDRTIQPEIYQIKKSAQPVKIEPVDVEDGKVKITNRHMFKNLNELTGLWQLTVDGDTIQRGFFELDLPAGQSVIDSIPFRMPKIEEGTECLLTISFLQKGKTEWAPDGYEIAFDQMIVKTPVYDKEPATAKGKISVTENANDIVVSGSNFRYVMSKKSGSFSSLQFNGTEYLEGGPVFNVWRAPLANDIDPWGSEAFKGNNFTPGLGRSIDNQLRTLGMRDLIVQVDETDVIKKSDGRIEIKLKIFSNSTLPANRRMNSYNSFASFERNETWTFQVDGTVGLEQEIIPHGIMPDMLQKIGLQFQLPKQFKQVEWYGRGPFENYPDRKTGAKIGHFKSDANQMYEPYIIPQEYGNRCDVRWLKVQNAEGKGLLIKGGEALNFSVHKFTTDNLDRAFYTFQLQDAPNTILNVDYEVTGVGETATRQLQRYRVLPGYRNYQLTIKPF